MELSAITGFLFRQGSDLQISGENDVGVKTVKHYHLQSAITFQVVVFLMFLSVL